MHRKVPLDSFICWFLSVCVCVCFFLHCYYFRMHMRQFMAYAYIFSLVCSIYFSSDDAQQYEFARRLCLYLSVHIKRSKSAIVCNSRSQVMGFTIFCLIFFVHTFFFFFYTLESFESLSIFIILTQIKKQVISLFVRSICTLHMRWNISTMRHGKTQ